MVAQIPGSAVLNSAKNPMVRATISQSDIWQQITTGFWVQQTGPEVACHPQMACIHSSWPLRLRGTPTRMLYR